MSDKEITFWFETTRPVRTVMIEGEVWWVADDVAKILGYRDAKNATRWLDDDEVNTTHLVSGNRGFPTRLIISESGLYALILRSRRPEAKAFRKWVTGEVLPTLRRSGRYETPGAPPVDFKALSEEWRKEVKAMLHDHHLRIVAATDAMRQRIGGKGEFHTTWDELAAMTNLSVGNVKRYTRLCHLLGFFDLDDRTHLLPPSH